MQNHLLLAPLLFVGEFQDHYVYATDSSFFQMLKMNVELCNNCVLFGKNVVGTPKDLSDIEKSPLLLGHLSLDKSSPISQQNNAIDDVIFVSLDSVRQVSQATVKNSENIWGPDVVSFVLASGGASELQAVENLINNRTVAEFLDLRRGFQVLQNLTGHSPLRDRLFFGLILFLSLVSFGFASHFLKQQWQKVGLALQRSGYSRLVYLRSLFVFSMILMSLALGGSYGLFYSVKNFLAIA